MVGGRAASQGRSQTREVVRPCERRSDGGTNATKRASAYVEDSGVGTRTQKMRRVCHGEGDRNRPKKAKGFVTPAEYQRVQTLLIHIL